MNNLHPETFDFLKELKKNNTKEWMDANRKWYQEIRQGLVDYAGTIQTSFAEVYPMHMMDPKKYLARINNNRRFHPDKPPYKTHFAFMVRHKGPGYGDFYIHLEPGNSMLASGIYHPPRELLQALRDLIDHRGEDLAELAAHPDFKRVFGGLQGDKLKKAPKGFELDHPHIDLLRHKDLIIMKNVKDDVFFTKKGLKEIQEAFHVALPFIEFIDDAISAV